MVSPRSLSLSRFLLRAQWMSKKVGVGGAFQRVNSVLGTRWPWPETAAKCCGGQGAGVPFARVTCAPSWLPCCPSQAGERGAAANEACPGAAEPSGTGVPRTS